MVSRILAACSLAAVVCLNSAAQSASSTPQSATPPGQTAPAQPSSPSLRLQDLPPDPHTPTPAEQEQQRQQAALAAAMRLASLQARWGPQMSTPGLSISLVEDNRAKIADGSTQITYHIAGAGFTAGEKLSLVRWPLGAEAQTVMSGVTFDTKGIAVCSAPAAAGAPATAAPSLNGPAAGLSAPPAAAPKAPPCTQSMQPNQPIEIQATAAAGEAIRVALVGDDQRHGAATSAVPFPIEGKDKNCKLQVLLGMKDAALVLVEGTGFPPNTPMKLESITFGDTRTLNSTTNAEGRTVFATLPTAKGHDDGDTTIRFAGITHFPTLETSNAPPPADPGCAPSVTFHWGKGSYKVE